MKRGVYRNNPAETVELCQYCKRSFHHQGIGPHEKACANKTVEQRQNYLQHAGKYTWKMQHGRHQIMIPGFAKLMTSPVPSRRKKQLPAPNALVVAGGNRIAVTLSFDSSVVREVATKLLGNAKLENVNVG